MSYIDCTALHEINFSFKKLIRVSTEAWEFDNQILSFQECWYLLILGKSADTPEFVVLLLRKQVKNSMLSRVLMEISTI